MARYCKTVYKCGTKEHMLEFRKGKLFTPSVAYFRGTEKTVALDKTEGYSVYKEEVKEDEVTLVVNGHKMEGLVSMFWDNPAAETTGVFCMHKLTDTNFNTQTGTLSEFSAKFGEYCVVILNMKEFLERVTKGSPFYGARGGVVYSEEGSTAKEPMNLFTKPLKFKEEEEYRMTFAGMYENTRGGIGKSIDIGSIEDITWFGKVGDLHKAITCIHS